MPAKTRKLVAAKIEPRVAAGLRCCMYASSGTENKPALTPRKKSNTHATVNDAVDTLSGSIIAPWTVKSIIEEAAIPNAPQGTHYAATRQDGPGLNILHRVFKLKHDKTNKLSFFLGYENFADGFKSPNNFEFESESDVRSRGLGGPTNQQLRIDVMKKKAKIESLTPRTAEPALKATPPADAPKTVAPETETAPAAEAAAPAKKVQP